MSEFNEVIMMIILFIGLCVLGDIYKDTKKGAEELSLIRKILEQNQGK